MTRISKLFGFIFTGALAGGLASILFNDKGRNIKEFFNQKRQSIKKAWREKDYEKNPGIFI